MSLPIKQNSRKNSASINRNKSPQRKQWSSPPKKKKEHKEPVLLSQANYDTMKEDSNVFQLPDMPLKYVLKCVSGIFKGRFVFITTHADGEIIGSGQAKKEGLTLQIQGVGLSTKHAGLKFDGFKSFFVQDFDSQRGTWLNAPPQGTQLVIGNNYYIGKHSILISVGSPINQIQQLCAQAGMIQLTDKFNHNGITRISDLLQALPTGFKAIPFSEKQRQIAIKIGDSVTWFKQKQISNRIRVDFVSQPLRGINHQIGFQQLLIYKSSRQCQLSQSGGDKIVARIKFNQGTFKMISEGQIQLFTKIIPNKPMKLMLYDFINLGDLNFQLTRYNYATLTNQGHRPTMQDVAGSNQDLGVSKHKLVSLFWVADGHGGSQCVQFLEQNLQITIKQNLKLIDKVKNLCQGVRILIQKTFYQLDFQFYKKYGDKALVSGATIIIILVIGCRVFVISLGDCVGILGKTSRLVRLNQAHKPSRVDQVRRIQQLGGFLQYQRLLGKMTVSRCFGSFQYKNLDDYQKQLKPGGKSFISCLPDIKAFDVDPQKDQYLLISTDGLYDDMTLQQAHSSLKVRFEGLQTEQTPQKIIKALFDKRQKEQLDNAAAILIILKKTNPNTNLNQS